MSQQRREVHGPVLFGGRGCHRRVIPFLIYYPSGVKPEAWGEPEEEAHYRPGARHAGPRQPAASASGRRSGGPRH